MSPTKVQVQIINSESGPAVCWGFQSRGWHFPRQPGTMCTSAAVQSPHQPWEWWRGEVGSPQDNVSVSWCISSSEGQDQRERKRDRTEPGDCLVSLSIKKIVQLSLITVWYTFESICQVFVIFGALNNTFIYVDYQVVLGISHVLIHGPLPSAEAPGYNQQRFAS